MSTDGRPVSLAVVGGGITGLAAAWEAVSAAPGGSTVTVFESADQPGGRIAAVEIAGRRVDAAADAFIVRRPEAVALCHELGIGDRLVSPATRTASVWARGRLRPLPAGLALGVPTRLIPLVRVGICSVGGLLRVGRDLVSPSPPGLDRGDDAVGEIVRRRLGRQVAERLADPLVGGIHAGPTGSMSAAAVFPALLEADRAGGSLMRALRPRPAAGATAPVPVFAAPAAGVHTLVEVLAQSLAAAGVDVRCGRAVTALTPAHGGWHVRSAAPGPHGDGVGDGDEARFDGVVLATPAAASATLLAPLDAAVAGTLAAMHSAGVAVVTFAFGDGLDGRLPEGSGFLVPHTGGGLVTACTFLTKKWPHLKRPGESLLRASVGRWGDERADAIDDVTLCATVVDELRTYLGPLAAPTETAVARWPAAFPQYEVGHPGRVAALRRAAAGLPPLELCGSALDGVGIPACIGSGRGATRAVLERLQTISAASA